MIYGRRLSPGYGLLLLVLAGLPLIGLSSLAAQERLHITSLHPAVRPGLLHRFQVQLQPAEQAESLDDDQRRAALEVAVLSDPHAAPLFQRRLEGVSADHLREGIVVNWLAPDEWPDHPLQVEVRWLLPSRPPSVRKPLRDLLASARLLGALAQRLDEQGASDPLPRLWLEQSAEQLRGPTDLYGARVVLRREEYLQSWLDGARDFSHLSEQAWRDPSDGSVQPLRIHMPDLPEPLGVVVALVDGPVHDKSRWPRMRAEVRRALLAAGWCVLEVFPAGDVGYVGHGRRRLQAVIAKQRSVYPDLPLVIFATGVSAQGALWQTLLHPGTLSAVILHNGRQDIQPQQIEAADNATARWLALHQQPERRLAHLYGVSAYVSGSVDRNLRRLWQRREEIDGRALVHEVDEDALRSSEWWQELIAAVGSVQEPREYRVLTPGRYGPWLVHQVEDRTRGGSLRFDAASETMIGGGLRATRVGTGAIPGPQTVVPLSSGGAHLSQAHGPLGAFASGPFVIILGSGEHQAAAERNQALLHRFVSDWGQHAWGRPPVVSDQAFHPEAWDQHHWVLIGGPRSNAVAARLQEHAPNLWPVQWDHRSVTIEGEQFVRSSAVGVAMAVPHPRQLRRQLVLLDGAAVWPAGDLPLRGLADFAWRIGDGAVRTRLLFPAPQDE